jgi:hypothetical protein
MTARIDVVALSDTNPVAAVISPTPVPMPTSAVSRGRPAAMKDPKVMSSTTAAIAMPTASDAVCSGMAWSASPPTSTVSPEARPAAAAANNACRSASVISVTGTV